MASKRKEELKKKRKALKKARQTQKPQSESKYALKQRGIYPLNSPYRPGGPWEAFA